MVKLKKVILTILRVYKVKILKNIIIAQWVFAQSDAIHAQFSTKYVKFFAKFQNE